jgi:hypothetical protein
MYEKIMQKKETHVKLFTPSFEWRKQLNARFQLLKRR